MAKIKCNINEDSTLVKFESLQNGEVFLCNGKPYYKFNKFAVIDIMEDGAINFNGDELVTYVRKAELKLTI